MKLRSTKLKLIVLFLLMLIPHQAIGESVREIVKKGNKAYAAEKFDEALSAYENAAEKSPESSKILYNKGTANYQKGDYQKAIDAFKTAALNSKDPVFEAKTKFNLGNCYFQEGEQKKGNDLNEALTSYAKSVQYFQEALELNPDFKESAENIEVTRLMMKSILEELKKQKEASEKQQQAQQEAVQKLEKLIKEQKNLKDRSENLRDQKDKTDDTKRMQEKSHELAKDQKKLSNDTKELSKNLPKQPPTPATTKHPVEQQLTDAAEHQDQAAEKLKDIQPDQALEKQQQSIEKLQQALKSLKNNNQNTQDQDNKQERNGNEDQKEDASEKQGQPNQKQPESEEQKKNAQLSDDALQIIDEEKENLKNRKKMEIKGYIGVERDW